MRMKTVSLLLGALAAGCVRSPFPERMPVEDDRSIVFPSFPAQPPIAVGTPGQHYTWDGELLRAVLIATTDLLPQRTPDVACSSRLETQRYHVIREGGLIFVYIYPDESLCGGGYAALDSGVKYAISAEGRILRRVFDGEPEQPLDARDWDAGVPARPGVVPEEVPAEAPPPHDVTVPTP